jgi:hypothetical protein
MKKVKHNKGEIVPFEKGEAKPRNILTKSKLLARYELAQRGINLIDCILIEIPKMKRAEDRAKAFIDLMPYVYPKLGLYRIEVDENGTTKSKDVPDVDPQKIMEKVKIIMERMKDDEGRVSSEVEGTNSEVGGSVASSGYAEVVRASDKEGIE